ncbi:lipid A-modifier LpxR family protein [Roseovarius aestuariivivens]|uniref:lipid A-modifier LpxR family protein n=1 Tax=Roseovarius aestuariivivens TaxID=1888910 RepID=UPI001081D8F4|nr:lipid A-modifier LpxR family protein [Roseovarius aestuariivivens]
MTRLLGFALAALFVMTAPLNAEGRTRIGYGWMLTNDIFGDTHDRWQTGSFASSRVWGPDWQGRLPEGFGDILELRFGGQIVSPENIARPTPGDRPFAGVLSLGLHTHFARGATQFALGGDIAVTGPQTGLDDFQGLLHDVLGGRDMSNRVSRRQVSNDVNPTAVAEIGHVVDLGGARLRPFVEGRWGLETLVRAGVDVTIGAFGAKSLMVRDVVSGHRYEAVPSWQPGTSVVFGADMAHVAESELLRSGRGYQLEARNRVRAGVNWQGERGTSVFYGLTWLDKEFKAQRKGQVVGSVRLRLNF